MKDADVRELERRTRNFAVAAVWLQRALRVQRELWDIANQFNRSANSVAANYRAMCRARSTREFAAKLHIVHEEADEAAHWLGMLHESAGQPNEAEMIEQLLHEAIRL